MRYFAYSQKEFVYKYVVMLSDIDQFKHMSFANYLKLMFLATDALLLDLQQYQEFIQSTRLKTHHSRMQFKNQTVFGDNILIKVNSSRVEQEKFKLLFTYVIEDTGTLVALGKLDLGLVNYNSSQGISIPSGLSSLLRSIEVDEANLLYKY